MNTIHINDARRMLNAREEVSLTILTAKNVVERYPRCRSLRYDRYRDVRNVKLFPSGQIRKIRDVLILEINDIPTYL